jgi:3-methyladenine DNA glycosylase AlkC
MEPLKEMFNKAFYERLASALHTADKNFHAEKFVKDTLKNLSDLSLNERMRNTSLVMKKHLPYTYKKCIDIMKKAVVKLPKGYTTLTFPDFVGLYGHDDVEVSLDALAFFTSYGSSEFAIREFLKRDFKKTIKVMEKWADDKNEHVRRLASEGSRPRLPWSFKLDEVIKNPESTRKILEKLKTDESLYVRKSVANHLNDFSKDHPTYMLDLVNKWDLYD